MSNTAVTVTARTHNPGFADTLRGELTLMRRRVVVWVSLGVWAVCVVVFAYLVSYLSTAGAAWYTPDQQDALITGMLPQGTSYYVLASLPLYGAPQMAILGAVLGASDYPRGTIRTIASRFPSRTPLAAARTASLVVIAAAAAVVTMLTSVLSSLLIAAISGRAWHFPPLAALAAATLAIWLVALTFIAIGFFVGVLSRNTVAAVAISVAWVLGVESLLVGVLAPVIPFMERVQTVLPVGAASALAAAFVPAGGQTVPIIDAGTGTGAAILVLVAWTVTSSAAAFIVFRWRDLA